MPTIVDCPSCQRKLRVPEDLLGKAVQCPTCGNQFTASSDSAPVPGSATGAVGSSQVKSWPEGGPPVPAADAPVPAVQAPAVAPHSEELEGEERPWELPDRPVIRRDCEPHRGTLVLVLGIISLVCIAICTLVGLPLGITAWVLGQRDLRTMQAKAMDPEGKGLTQAGWICGIIGTVLNSLCGLAQLAYIGFVVLMISSASSAPVAPATKSAPKPVPAKGKDKLEPARPDQKQLPDEP